MSEYQYDEFQTIDRPLSQQEKTELRDISTRATIAPTRVINVYNWGDFRYDPDGLWPAIDGRGAFRHFRNEISEHDEERKRWFAFRDARRREQVLEWLEDEGIEPIRE